MEGQSAISYNEVQMKFFTWVTQQRDYLHSKPPVQHISFFTSISTLGHSPSRIDTQIEL